MGVAGDVVGFGDRFLFLYFLCRNCPGKNPLRSPRPIPSEQKSPGYLGAKLALKSLWDVVISCDDRGSFSSCPHFSWPGEEGEVNVWLEAETCTPGGGQ